MNDRPTAIELVAAARHYLEHELIPTLSDARLRFQTLVTANVLSIVERELQTEEAQLRQEWDEWAAFLDVPVPAPLSLAALRESVRQANEQLSCQIRSGAFDERPRFLALSRQLRQLVQRKLEIANPRYLASFQNSPSRPQPGSSASPS
ncbi:MAG TPA: DUF6285 domain-containing protein [Gemmataceae bacterium]|nr:DUF6285 domain-containing protein [Gemmataceae bacterium]